MKNKRTWVLIASAAILTIIVACSLPITFTIPTEEPKIITVQVTSVVPATSAPQPTSVPPTAQIIVVTATPPAPTVVVPTAPVVAAPVDWSGAWVIWMGGGLQQINVDFVLRNNQITGNAAIGSGNSIAFYGLISADNRSVSGNWENTNGSTGTFTWHILDSYNQFNGNMGSTQQICGARSSISRPAVCFIQ
jgi:hypothetical protein